MNPCSYGEVRCGTGAQCTPQNHQAVCICPPGTQGNPFVSCITGHCQYNEDCADHEACDRLNRVCRPVCDEDTCALNAICTGRRHQPQCECRPGYRGNPFVQCDVPREPPTKVEPECKQDADCPSQLACINQRCANPCATPHVCTPQQTCHVLDTLPLRTMICKCPSDTITDNSGNCVPIKHEVVSGCQSNDECGNTEVCQRGVCIDACRLERCGVNAQCRSRDHYAECTCARGYEGNPRVECQLIVHEQPKTPNAECTKNDDCPYDKTCRNERCVNPCVEDSCGRGAYCHVQNREPVCRCPSGFTGDARVACVPRKYIFYDSFPPQALMNFFCLPFLHITAPDVSTIGCKSNSDCSLSESCVNERCINPCNCGPNAECIVRNHHPVCYCQPGYSGNAQFGCVQIGCQSDDECSSDQQCVNRECVNPCLISDPCALNAECFGRNHRATCRCPAGLEGDPFQRCVRVECHSDYDCATNQACVRNQCVNPCQDSPCAQNAICQALQHRAVCRCPETMPLGNPYAYCERRPVEPVCRDDGDCPSRLACIDSKCQNPCTILSPCASSAKCSVLDSVPVRTMVCECPESYVPDARGECKPIVLQSPPGCSSDADCPDQEACINRQCRNPCNCGTNAICQVQNHRATCSCQDGYEGNPYALCRTIGCRIDSECDSGKACINGNCINPCLVNDPCGINAECYVQSNTAMCRCKSGYRGNAYERCRVIGCLTNNDCPSDKMCQNEQCVNPCIYHNTCSPRAECRAQNHLAVCRCPAGFLGNPYVDCRPEPQPMCKVDTDCPARLACINDECVDPCLTLEPCNRPAQCEVTPTSPVRTMICICPDGYISSGSGTCKPTKTIVEVGGCIADSDCATDKSCVNGICRDPCNCGLNAECRIKDHKPVCTCRQGYDGNPEFECSKIECAINSDCPSTHACRNQLCVPVCQGEQCGTNAECLAVDHRAICECVPGFRGNARIACTPLGCRTDGECPSDKACVNGKCENPCDTKAICAYDEICKVYNHQPECACPPGTIARRNGCEPQRDIPICRYDGDCPSQTACIRGECVNPCNATHPCGVNADCRVLDTVPVRTMICECLEGYTGNAAVQCDKRSLCVIEKGFVRDVDGQCVCPPGTALDIYEYCAPCLPQQGFKIDENGRCVCALERGMVIDERGRCICPTDHGYRLTPAGECIAEDQPGCETNEDCADNRFCNTRTKTCEDPCLQKVCGVNAFCNAINHRAQCQCITGYTGNPELFCNHTNFRTDFPRPDMLVSCLADGVQVEIHITEPGFNGVLYVKGHSKDEECRRVVNLAGESVPRTEIFRVHFGSCGMQAVKDIASFVLVIQKHPKLVTYKAQAYNIKCVYQTGEKNVTLGFNVSMLTTAGTIANTGPPPICQMRIITHEGEEINSAEIGDNLKLQVDVEPASEYLKKLNLNFKTNKLKFSTAIYGGFARSCIAKTMEDNIENEYIVTDENGCATDASIFGEWEYNADTNSLMANFNAFKFPSSDNIRFQCNIRVCFGKCQPVNCRGYNAFGRRRRRAIADNSTDTTAVATDTGMEGQLREEITISSNAILTFEKRSGPGISDANSK